MASLPAFVRKLMSDPKPAGSISGDSSDKSGKDGPKDTGREGAETLVFVVVLVMLLKLFVAEAFVIPTGSMAETLWGDQVEVKCRECGFVFALNASENSRADGKPQHHYVCPNCGYECNADVWKDHQRGLLDTLRVWLFPREDRDLLASSGDRVLVSKYAYHLHAPKRFDVPVFKYPVEPFSEKDGIPINYIKRLVGLPGETIAVFHGDLYAATDLDYSWRDKPSGLKEQWLYRWMFPSDEKAVEHFQNGKFHIIRKTPDEIMAVRRIVFDFDHQPKTLSGTDRVRWEPVPSDGTGWETEEKGFRHAGNLGWLRYNHRRPGWSSSPTPGYITDHLGYNAELPDNWVPDLLVETTAEITSTDAEVVLELNRGEEIYSAIFARGECQLARRKSNEDFSKNQPIDAIATKINKPGKYALRFANIDSRLTVWVDCKPLAFGEKANIDPPAPTEIPTPSEADRDRPVRIGSKGDVHLTKVKIFRDIFYTCSNPVRLFRDHEMKPRTDEMPYCGKVQTFYVQPGHFLCFGDNSNSSSDGRCWGLVPERLLLGRAVLVYWPRERIGVIE